MKIFFVVISVVLLFVAIVIFGFLFAFPATQVVHANYHISFQDEKGQPLKNLPVDVWEYEHYTQHAKTNEEGKVEFKNQSYQTVKMFFQFWNLRPDVFSMRLRFPELSKLYYRFEVKKEGPVSYEVFNDSYDYFFGEKWLGTFNDKTQIAQKIKDYDKTYNAVAPENECKCIDLWKTKVRLQESGKNQYEIYLDLQQSGRWQFK